jgi:hypothetical protein
MTKLSLAPHGLQAQSNARLLFEMQSLNAPNEQQKTCVACSPKFKLNHHRTSARAIADFFVLFVSN